MKALFKKPDSWFAWTTKIMTVLTLGIALTLFVFMIVKSVPGLKEFGIGNLLGGKFEFNTNKFGIWLPLFITLIISAFALLIAIPTSFRISLFIKFRLRGGWSKTFKVMVAVFASIPSVMFGLFAQKSLGLAIASIAGMNGVYNMLNAIVMLSLMLIPTITVILTNSLEAVDDTYMLNGLALGLTKSKVIYTIYRKLIRKSVMVAGVVAFSRAIAETIALSMIMQSESYGSALDSGNSLVNSDVRPLAVVIVSNLFAENGGELGTSVLFFYGLVLFVFVLAINLLIYLFSRPSARLKSIITKIKQPVSKRYSQLRAKTGYKLDKSKVVVLNKVHSTLSWTREILAVSFGLGLIGWLIVDIFIKGSIGMSVDSSSFWSYSQNSTGQALVNTIILVFLSLVIAIPIAFLTALCFSEFVKSPKIRKYFNIIIDSLNATPSIVFGMFGLLLFIQVFGLTSNGTKGKSLFAGVLTITITVLPLMIRTFNQSLETVSKELRFNAYSLGVSKSRTIFMIVIPTAAAKIGRAILLSTGRILSETGPVFLTAGLVSGSSIDIWKSSQTLTSRIYYYAIYSSDSYATSTNIMYETALVVLIIVSVIVIASECNLFIKEIKNFILRIKDKIKRRSNHA